VITKSHIIGLLAILVVGFLIFRSGDEPSDSGDQPAGSESATDRRLQPREPAFQTPGSEHGIAGRLGARSAPPGYGSPHPYPAQPYRDPYSGRFQTPRPYGGQASMATDGYRFRPLGKQEQERMQAAYPELYEEGYATPYYQPSPGARPRETAPVPSAAPPTYREPASEIYGFRPLENSPGARGRWQGPYQEPGRVDTYPTDPWMSPPLPEWGSTPPAQRMYPNFYRDSGRRLTAR